MDINAVSTYLIETNYLASQYIHGLLIHELSIRLKIIDIGVIERRRPLDPNRCLVIVDQCSISTPLIPYGQKLKACFPASGLLVIGDPDFCGRLQRIFQPWVLATVEYVHVKGLAHAVGRAAELLSETEPGSLVAEPSSRPFLLQHTGISARELEIFELLCLRLSNKEIANLLDITVATVKFHVSNIFGKTNVRRRREFFSKVDSLMGQTQIEASPFPSSESSYITVA